MMVFYSIRNKIIIINLGKPLRKGDLPFGLVLKLLFLLKGINGIEPTLNNLTSFMIDSIDCDRIELEKRIKKVLENLKLNRRWFYESSRHNSKKAW